MSQTTQTCLVPHLCCRNAADAVDFYRKAFNAEVLGAFSTPDGKLMHGALKINGAQFFLTEENPACGALGPQSLGGSAVTLHLHVPDCDAVFQRAVDAGCQVGMPLENMFWGDRYGFVIDPYGHKWAIATTIKQVKPEELQAAVASMGAR
ncbi:MAG TPA: VOC family protein [Bryobacteraceae bacterium]|nr:VOC family protein [Bryobacteraceae bacterium]